MSRLALLAARARANHAAAVQWATWDPNSLSANCLLTDGNTRFEGASTNSGNYVRCCATAPITGKRYIEVDIRGLDGDWLGYAIGDRQSYPLSDTSPAYPGADDEATSFFYRDPTGCYCYWSASTGPYGRTDPDGIEYPLGRFSCAVDANTREVWFRWNPPTGGPSAWLGGGDPTTGTSPTRTLSGTGDIHIMAVTAANDSGRYIELIGDPANYQDTAPTGFSAGLPA